MLRRLLRSRVGKVLAVLTATLLLMGAAGLVWYQMMVSKLDDVDRVELAIPEQTRPKALAVPAQLEQSSEPVTILLAGVDAGPGPSIADAVKAGTWSVGSHRSDTMMVAHFPPNRKRAYLISLPRDTLVDIPGHGKAKLNAALSYGGPSLLVQTVETFTGLRMNHLALVDWDGFKELTNAIGGVTVTIPETVHDPYQNKTWEAGEVNLQGEDALAYVRQRHGLPGGDFDRIARQQNFLRAVLDKTMSRGTLANPVKLTGVVSALTPYLTLDSDFDTDELLDLALSLRGLEKRAVLFVTVPMDRFDTHLGQSVVVSDEARTQELFAAVGHHRLERWVNRNPDTVLGSDTDVR